MGLLVPVLIHIPEGVSLLGSTTSDPLASDRDHQCIEVFVGEFFCGQYPVTNREFYAFVAETGHSAPRHWSVIQPDGQHKFAEDIGDHPVTFIAWNDAFAYTQWLKSKTGQEFSLATEAEWEKAARGPDGLIWPWGNEFKQDCCNSAELGLEATCPVSEMPDGRSPYGCYHMVGNVWEWCLDFYEPLGHRRTDRTNPINVVPSRQRVVKGGSYYYDRSICRCASRDYTNANNEGGIDDGFRVVVREMDSHGTRLVVS